MPPGIASCPFGATCSHSPVKNHYFVFLATLDQLCIIRQLRLLIAGISTPEMLHCSIYWLFLLLGVFTNGWSCPFYSFIFFSSPSILCIPSQLYWNCPPNLNLFQLLISCNLKIKCFTMLGKCQGKTVDGCPDWILVENPWRKWNSHWELNELIR